MDCIIIHGSADDKNDKSYSNHWIQWINKKLSKNKINAYTPSMPEPWKPNYISWKKKFCKFTKLVNENSVLIGHSAGCAFLVRWLGDTKKKVKKLILIAPWKIAYRKDGSDKEFYEYRIEDFVKLNVEGVVIFTSNDEEPDGKKSAELFHRALGGRIIELENKGHYTLDDMGTEEFPELLREILE